MALSENERELLRQFASLTSDSDREIFIQRNPLIKHPKFAIEALIVSKIGRRDHDIPTAWMFSVAAFSLGGEIPDHLLGAEAAEIAASLAPMTGNEHHAANFLMSAQTLRAEADRLYGLFEIPPVISENLRSIKASCPNTKECLNKALTLTNMLPNYGDPIENLVMILTNQNPITRHSIFLLSMLCVGLFHLKGRNTNMSILPTLRVVAITMDKVVTVENDGWSLLSILGEEGAQLMKKRYMAQYNILTDDDFNRQALSNILDDLCNVTS